jgi:hypothetical protein
MSKNLLILLKKSVNNVCFLSDGLSYKDLAPRLTTEKELLGFLILYDRNCLITAVSFNQNRLYRT